MTLLDLTFSTPAENLACDEALLDFFENNGGDGALRFWAPENYFVVVGYANHVQKEVNVAECESENVPIFRRCSGGGTVLQGPGCLNYSLIMRIEENGPLRSITSANQFIMERNRAAIQSSSSRREEAPIQGSESLVASAATIKIRGCSDITLDPRPLGAPKRSEGGSTLDPALKFSGNAQRRKKQFLLFHGTFLLQFDIPLIDKFLRMPSKEPDYREGRSHGNFLTNLDLPAEAVKRALREAWGAQVPLEVVPHDEIALLARDKYVTKEWNFKF
ncbi:MAG TPA: lipoate--protein ligase family protein [Verrucomicrobiae bacterium]|jgi:lipoate-protein ligase A|nr:lipoate--protein ligase family protein [Verrucomicrobiae bacterium]